MTPERWLEAEKEGKLTPEEVAEGWRFCCEFDGLLIHRDTPEGECCLCLQELRSEQQKNHGTITAHNSDTPGS